MGALFFEKTVPTPLHAATTCWTQEQTEFATYGAGDLIDVSLMLRRV